MNAICREQNGIGSCQCQPDYFGNPYEGCRPECVVSSDCPSNKACVNSKCQNPCPGVCAHNAECKVLNHVPSCHCGIGFTGNPYSYCNFIQNERKPISIFIFQNLIKTIFKNTEHLISNVHKNSHSYNPFIPVLNLELLCNFTFLILIKSLWISFVFVRFNESFFHKLKNVPPVRKSLTTALYLSFYVIWYWKWIEKPLNWWN